MNNLQVKKYRQYGIALMLLLPLISAVYAQETTEREWKLIWEDQFESEGQPDVDKWSFAGRRSSDWACYCTDSEETAFVKEGKLFLRSGQNTQAGDSVKYQTGCLHTKDHFSFLYGKVEVRAKLSQGKGSWPAIWMMPRDARYGGWPASGEIDIMEHLNYDSIFYQTIHSTYVDQMDRKDNPPYFHMAEFLVNEFNTFGLEWHPDRLDFFLNGRKTFSYPKVEAEGKAQWPFDQPFYLILNQALGGNWVGEIHDEDLPVEMQVDWVKVYQKNSK